MICTCLNRSRSLGSGSNYTPQTAATYYNYQRPKRKFTISFNEV